MNVKTLNVRAIGRLRPLVRAATWSQEPEQEWIKYVAQLGEETPNDGERRLFSVISHKIGQGSADLKGGELLNSETRHAQVSSIILSKARLEVEETLSKFGLEPIFVKGTALQVRAYPVPWLRRSADIDMYLPRRDANIAYSALAAAGWGSTHARVMERGLPYFLDRAPALTLKNHAGVELDIHWNPRPSLKPFPELSAQFEASSRCITHWGQTLRIPSDTWLMFETLDHAVRPNSVTPIRWIADAHSLMNTDNSDIDWAELFEITSTSRNTAVIACALDALLDAGVSLPDSAVQWLRRVRCSYLERLDLWVRFQNWPPLIRSVMSSSPDFFLRYPGTFPMKLLRLPSHLCREVAGFDSWRAAGKCWIERRTLGKS